MTEINLTKQSRAFQNLLSIVSTHTNPIQPNPLIKPNPNSKKQNTNQTTKNHKSHKSRSSSAKQQRLEEKLNVKYKLLTTYFQPLLEEEKKHKETVRNEFLYRLEGFSKEKKARLQILIQQRQRQEMSCLKKVAMSKGSKDLNHRMGHTDPIHKRSQQIIAKKKALLQLKRTQQYRVQEETRQQEAELCQRTRHKSRSRSPNEDFYEEKQRWLKRKKERVDANRKLQERRELHECSFSPKVGSRKAHTKRAKDYYNRESTISAQFFSCLQQG